MHDFLKQFTKRMKNVAMYSLLVKSTGGKGIWKKAGFNDLDEQLNIVYSVLLYIMEQSLKEVPCTMDHISSFLDNINSNYFKKQLSLKDVRELSEFIVNTVLSNEGVPMYFKGYNYEKSQYDNINVSYIANKIIYLNDDAVKRTSYYLTDDGYNLLLATLEIENNMKLSIHEMIFELHLEKSSYNHAIEDIKNIFNLLRIQFQKINQSIDKIKRNALSYSVVDYKILLEENLETITNTKEKFEGYRKIVLSRVKDLELEHINVKKLDEQGRNNLEYLGEINEYLTKVIAEHQKILKRHFDLKTLYSDELEQLSKMSLIKRFDIRTKIYDKVLDDADKITCIDDMLHGLFVNNPEKTFNILKAFEEQSRISKKHDDDESEIIEFDYEEYEKQLDEDFKILIVKYTKILKVILEKTIITGESELLNYSILSDDGNYEIIPDIDIFKEIMVDLLKNKSYKRDDIVAERAKDFSDSRVINLGNILLDILESDVRYKHISELEVEKKGDVNVAFENILVDTDYYKKVICSNVRFKLIIGENYGI